MMQEIFKKVCSRFPKGVTVVTARRPGDGLPVGMTVSAFTSVSLDPPTILVCLRLNSSTTKALLEAPRNLGHRTILTTMYAAGPRVSEVAHLKMSDIDSLRNVIWIRGGKGRKDRYTLLSPKLLEELGAYWRWCRPQDWLFPASHDPRLPMDERVGQKSCWGEELLGEAKCGGWGGPGR